ncbi:Ni,Fe-hydrogenase III large subunit [Actinomadura pelletieri DSM 43383]|uniref:Ni,Fe-hydrogenase III large subunit n=1 Tax=Actinomadura pelletieri DSM 43383 TaxID=1120940 RepID=A0A495QK96_9ACTN|nr:NADH-quinone oxidoreductase subunit C [Actinomadura pelletieri]RKS73017.1 Ni,Fe-hydrogenase III large subunit [Actinomadura pelletieri DSM 43383]
MSSPDDRPDRTAIEVDTEGLPGRAATLLDEGARLALVAAHQDPDALRVVYLFTRPGPDRRTELHVRLDQGDPVLPSLAGLSFPAGRFEREMHDLYGIVPQGHPLPRRLVRHHHWPRGWYPMRDDAGPPPEFGDPEGPYPFVQVEGPGVYEIPVGPVHAGLIEPGHFRFSVVGESILKLKARLWFVHKGIEKLFQGRLPADAVPLAERVSGDTTVGHTLAFCLAVEDAAGVRVGPGTQRNRAMLLELERLYNHVTDLGALCNDVGHSILNAQFGRVREQLLRLNAAVTGHRLLRGGVRLGGAVLRVIPDPALMRSIEADIAELVELALGHTVVADRFTGTAPLSAQAARDLGALGYVARASGLDIDARRDHPCTDLRPALTVPTADSGDVLARFQIRAREIAASIAIITDLAQGATPGSTTYWPPLDHATGGGGPDGRASGVGIVEGWRGTIVHRVELAPDGTLTRTKIVDPSFFNWPALPIALTGAIVPDFPLVNKSFNLSYAGNDL